MKIRDRRFYAKRRNIRGDEFDRNAESLRGAVHFFRNSSVQFWIIVSGSAPVSPVVIANKR